MNRSENIAELAAALAEAQGEMEGAAKSAANPFFKSKYADLAAVFDAIRGPLAKNKIAVMQFVRTSSQDGVLVVEVETVFTHSSGQWVGDTLILPVAKADAQGIGSAITYAKRYGLQALAGIPSEDDDGEAAVGRSNGQHKAAQAAAEVVAQGRTKLEACRNVEELRAAFKSLPEEVRRPLTGFSKELAAKLEAANAA